jgi:predicted transcriptional regulator
MENLMSETLTAKEVVTCTADVTSAYFASHEVEVDAIPEVVKKIFMVLLEISRDANNMKHRPALTPAVPVEDSIHEDYIVCLEDGKKLQMLKRHLNTVYGMTPEQYKERWGLPPDYPVVSPSYARRRSDIARMTGLGSNGRKKLIAVNQ